jgi:hypothetical protein
MAKIEIEHSPLDKVHINELSVDGVVIAIHICTGETEYKVRYFDNAQARTEYFFDFELSRIKA